MTIGSILSEIPWETRNLGLPSFAVSADFFETPDAAAVGRELARLTAELGRIFVQARLPKGRIKAWSMLEGLGFRFIETCLRPVAVLADNPALSAFVEDPGRSLTRRFRLEDLAVERMEKTSRAVCDEVAEIAASSFVDDRFHLDPNCPRERADRRFALWTSDLIADSTVAIDLLRLRGQVIGFFARRGADLILAGLGREHAGSGLGEFFWLGVLNAMRVEGETRAETLISANNTSVLNLYARLGFKFRGPEATFHYWGGGEPAAGGGFA